GGSGGGGRKRGKDEPRGCAAAVSARERAGRRAVRRRSDLRADRLPRPVAGAAEEHPRRIGLVAAPRGRGRCLRAVRLRLVAAPAAVRPAGRQAVGARPLREAPRPPGRPGPGPPARPAAPAPPPAPPPSAPPPPP